MTTNQLLAFSIEILILLLTLPTGLLLLQKRARQYRATRLLTWLLGIFALTAVNRLFGSLVPGSRLVHLNLLSGLAAAPLLLLYLRSLLGDRLSRGRDGHHFFPFFFILLIGLIPGQLLLWMGSWWSLLPALYVIAYLLVAWFYIQNRLGSLVQIRSRLPMGKLRLVYVLLLAWGLMSVAEIVQHGLRIMDIAEEAVGLVVLLLRLLLVAALTAMALVRERPAGAVKLQEEAFLDLIAGREEPEPEDIRSNASLFKTLDATLQSEKYFLDGDLRLNQLAELMGKTPREISRAIHHVGGQSFFDYINGYRALSAQVIIDDPENKQSLEEIQHAAGIESRLVFDQSFKRLTGSRPAAYYKLNRP